MAVSKKSKKEIIGLCGAVCLQRNADMFLGKLAPAPPFICRRHDYFMTGKFKFSDRSLKCVHERNTRAPQKIFQSPNARG
jgi:hypothetical protein